METLKNGKGFTETTYLECFADLKFKKKKMYIEKQKTETSETEVKKKHEIFWVHGVYK